MNKIIILENNGGRLANQLWVFASIYAYCLEFGYSCENYSFFRYARYFNFKISNKLVGLLFFRFLYSYKIKKFLYKIIVIITKAFKKKFVISDGGKEFLLSLDENRDVNQTNILKFVKSLNNKTCYFSGWLFRNNAGLKKFYDEIKLTFRPKQEFIENSEKLIKNLRLRNKLVVGVHIRQGDYKTWQGGKYYYSCHDVRRVLDDFLNIKKEPQNVVFVICSDGKIDENEFLGLNYVKGPGTEIEDLYCLASTDIIVGSNSTYGSWAAYYGDVPFFHFSHDKLDWDNPIKIL